MKRTTSEKKITTLPHAFLKTKIATKKKSSQQCTRRLDANSEKGLWPDLLASLVRINWLRRCRQVLFLNMPMKTRKGRKRPENFRLLTDTRISRGTFQNRLKAPFTTPITCFLVWNVMLVRYWTKCLNCHNDRRPYSNFQTVLKTPRL